MTFLKVFRFILGWSLWILKYIKMHIFKLVFVLYFLKPLARKRTQTTLPLISLTFFSQRLENYQNTDWKRNIYICEKYCTEKKLVCFYISWFSIRKNSVWSFVLPTKKQSQIHYFQNSLGTKYFKNSLIK